MRYILDANVLIDAKNRLFPMEEYPKFWDWLLRCAKDDIIFIPESVFEEIQQGNDPLAKWTKDNKNIFFVSTAETYEVLSEILQAYSDIAGIPSQECLEALRADPYIIAHGYIHKCTVVTSESHLRDGSISIKKLKYQQYAKNWVYVV